MYAKTTHTQATSETEITQFDIENFRDECFTYVPSMGIYKKTYICTYTQGLKSDSLDVEHFRDECVVHGTLDRRVITITQNGHALDMSDFSSAKKGGQSAGYVLVLVCVRVCGMLLDGRM